MLDSSPVAFPTNPSAIPPRRPLKRSASTASLLTPPRTHRKHARGRSRGSCDSDSEIDVGADADGDAVLTSDDDGANAGPSHKKRRRVGEAAQKADEDAFWLSGAPGTGSAGLNSGTSVATRSASSSVKTTSSIGSAKLQSAAPLLYRRLLAQQAQAEPEVDVAPVSPPPSHRKTTTTTIESPGTISSVSPPVTPRAGRTTRSAAKRAFRDSPDNPFLATPQNHADDSDAHSPTRSPTASASSANPSPHTPTPHQEKPTLTYVFRGVRRTYQNPLYNHAENRPFSPPPASKLPLDDPDYSPAIHCTPKLLFPEARRGARGKANANARGRSTRQRTAAAGKRKRSVSPGMSGDEDDGAQDVRPMKLNFGAPKTKTTKTTLAQEMTKAGEVFSS